VKASICLPLVFAVVLLASIGSDSACAAGEACPDYHREDKAYAARVKADLKRYARSQGVPERLMYLYDQLGNCPACLGGDAEHPILPYLYIVYSPGAEDRSRGLRNIRVRGTAWSADEEYGARQGMRDGYIEAFYILLEATPCECCTASTEEEFDEWDQSEPDWTDSPDWNDELNIDTNRSDAHENVDELGADPADLTEIDDKDRYPDELPVPPLELPPPVRPMTTGCSACQDPVNQYNDLAVRINEQSRVVAVAERRLRIAGIAIRFVLREIHAHERKAQNEAWAAEYDRLWQRYGDLVATSQSDQRALDNARAARTEMLTQLATLRRLVIECEERCRLLDEQAPPTADPEPLPDPTSNDAGAGLPPYVRIASQVCPLCTEALERRNAIARDMNELVQGMIDAGINDNSIKAWEAMRADLDAANTALRDCATRCAVPIESTPTMAPDADLPADRCPPCQQYAEQVENLRQELSLLHEGRNPLILEIESTIQTLRGLDQEHDRKRFREIEARLRRLNKRMEAFDNRLAILHNRILRAEMRLRHCRATQCPQRYSYYSPNTRIPDEDGFDNIWFYAKESHFFLTTSCEACKAQADAINDWVMRQYEEWLTADFLRSLSTWSTPDESALIANRYRFVEFLTDLELQIAALKDCEARACPLTHAATIDAAYQQDDIASEQCLDDKGTRAAAESGDIDALPRACNGSWLHRWLLACEDDSCAGTGDVAVRTDSPMDAACKDQGVPIDGIELADTKPLGATRFVAYDILSMVTLSSSGTCSPPADQVVDAGALRTSQGLAGGDLNDPFFLSSGNVVDAQEDQWGLRYIGVYEAISVNRRYAVTGHSVVVAVIDSGLDIHHPDIRNMVWSNPGELSANGVDDDGNGFIDDVRGWNFVGNDSDVRDHNGHGTMVAGIIGAVPDNGIGIAGVNPWTRIMPLKVTNFLGRGNSIDIAAAITYAVNEGADIINVSLGGPEFSTAERAAVDYAASKGVPIVVAAGNQGADAAAFWPAGLDNVITVAATESGDVRARYSNWGSPVDVAAPGSNILSLRARHTDLMYFVDDDYPRGRNVIGEDRMLYYASGTSFAAPFVAGVASLIMSLRPDVDASDVRRMVLHSAANTETPGFDALTGFGVVDARAAMTADPGFFIDAAIVGVSAKRRDGQVFVQVSGTANADEFKSAVVSVGAGRAPGEWQPSGDPILSPVENDVIAEIGAAELSGSPVWTLRLEVLHENGSRREARFELNLQ